MVGLPYSVTSGMLDFAPLGPAYLASGIAAGLATSSAAGLAASFFGGTPFQINGPRTSVAVLIAGLLTAITAHAEIYRFFAGHLAFGEDLMEVAVKGPSVAAQR